MPSNEHYKKLENLYLSGPINTFFKPQISISKGKAEIITYADSRFYHAAEALHGSIFFKALDDAAYFAAASRILDYFLVTTTFQIHFIRPTTSKILKSIGEIVQITPQYILANSLLYNEKNKEIARGTGTFMKSQTKLSAEIGYQ